MNILFLAKGQYPYGAAYSTRIKALLSIFKDTGHNVTLVVDNINSLSSKIENKGGELYEVEGEEFYSLTETKNLKFVERLTLSKRYYNFIDGIISTNEYDLILSSSNYERFNSVLKLSKKYDVPLVLESCEWYDSSNWKFGIANPLFWKFKYAFKFQYPKVNGVISISRLLYDHYQKYGIETFILPTIMSNVEEMNLKANNKKTQLVFAGSIARSKELVANIIEGIKLLEKYEDKIEFNIYGPTRREVEKQLGKRRKILTSMEEVVIIHGSIAQNLVKDKYRKSDYSIFIRPNRRSSNAGFPTKLVESMQVGTPVITNITGDIGEYLIDEVNGMIVESVTPKDIATKLSKIVNISEEKKNEIRVNAKMTSDNTFDISNFKSELSNYLEKVVSSYGE